jgi:hypothetical protein
MCYSVFSSAATTAQSGPQLSDGVLAIDACAGSLRASAFVIRRGLGRRLTLAWQGFQLLACGYLVAGLDQCFGQMQMDVALVRCKLCCLLERFRP